MMPARFYFCLILFCIGAAASAQTAAIEKLRKDQESAKKKIATTNVLLKEAQNTTKGTATKIRVLESQLTERRRIISSLNKEIIAIDYDIRKLTSKKDSLERQLSHAKEEYAKTIYHTYIRKSSYNEMLFILSAETFSQAYRRMRYLQEYASSRKQQALDIARLTDELAEKSKSLEQRKQEKDNAITQEESERQKMQSEKQSQDVLLGSLKQKEQTLQNQLAQQQKQENELNKKIQQLINDEIRKAEAKQAAKQPKKEQPAAGQPASKPASPELKMTKEETTIAGNFEANKGRLPWPVENGAITRRFGVHPHPVLKYVTTDNKGIYIQTTKGADARCVFDGVVSTVFSIPGDSYVVMVKHGNYRTVYANLTTIYVKVDDKITTKQKVGKIFVDDDNKAELYFQIYKDTNLQNPEAWITR